MWSNKALFHYLPLHLNSQLVAVTSRLASQHMRWGWSLAFFHGPFAISPLRSPASVGLPFLVDVWLSVAQDGNFEETFRKQPPGRGVCCSEPDATTRVSDHLFLWPVNYLTRTGGIVTQPGADIATLVVFQQLFSSEKNKTWLPQPKKTMFDERRWKHLKGPQTGSCVSGSHAYNKIPCSCQTILLKM